MRRILPALIAAVLAFHGSLLSLQGGPPYSPQAALETFRLADGFQIELFAAEPLVSDPVAMEVDSAPEPTQYEQCPRSFGDVLKADPDLGKMIKESSLGNIMLVCGTVI